MTTPTHAISLRLDLSACVSNYEWTDHDSAGDAARSGSLARRAGASPDGRADAVEKPRFGRIRRAALAHAKP